MDYEGTMQKETDITYIHRRKRNRDSKGNCRLGFRSLYAQFRKLLEAGEAGLGWLLWGCTVDFWPDVARLGGRASALRNLEMCDYGWGEVLGLLSMLGLFLEVR